MDSTSASMVSFISAFFTSSFSTPFFISGLLPAASSEVMPLMYSISKQKSVSFVS